MDRLLEATEGQEKVSLDDALNCFGERSYGPLILIPAILLTLPTGALPGMPLALGGLIALTCGRLMVGRTEASVPRVIGRLKFPRSALAKGRQKTRRPVAAVDAVVRKRLTFVLKPPMLQLVALVCIALCIVLIPVEFIPFATAIPGSLLIILGVAVTVRDGLLALIGVAAAVAGGAGVWMLIT